MNDAAAREIAARQHGCIHRDQFDGDPAADWYDDAPLVWSIPDLIDARTQDVAWMLAVDSTMFAGSATKVVASHVTACRFYGVGVLTGPAEFWTLGDQKLFVERRVRIHVCRELPPHRMIGGVPVTSPAATVQDLIDDFVSSDHVGRIVSDMIQRGVATREELDGELGADTVKTLLDVFAASAARH